MFTISLSPLHTSGCRKPNYGPHKSVIIMEQVQTLLHNEWIEECKGPWGSMIVLTPKPHQEHINKIEEFIWRMCISYHKLNSITEPFEYPIPRCDNAVESLGIPGGKPLLFLALDAKQGYHQILVRKCDRKKLAFFAPDNKKYTYRVMPFGPTNAPPFYTCMMTDFQTDWNKLFLERVVTLPPINGHPITVAPDTLSVSAGPETLDPP